MVECLTSDNMSIPSANVAELNLEMKEDVSIEEIHHLIKIQLIPTIKISSFRGMFYSSGNGNFQIANTYSAHPTSCIIKNSVWGIIDISTNVTYNVNKLGGRDNDPEGTRWAWAYSNDIERLAFIQTDILTNLEKDTNTGRDTWNITSLNTIEDQLYNLSFASEVENETYLNITTSRSWNEVIDALHKSSLHLGIKLSEATLVNFFINVRITNGNPLTSPNLIRCQFRCYVESDSFE